MLVFLSLLFSVFTTSTINLNSDFHILPNHSGIEVEQLDLKDIEYESLRYLAVMDSSYIFVIEEYYLPLGETVPVFRLTNLIEYDDYGKEINKLILDYKLKEFHNHNNYLVIIDYDNQIQYLDSEFDFSSEPDIQTEFYGSYQAQACGDLFINQLQVEELSIDSPGYYNIEIIEGNYSYSYDITIYPEIEILGEKYSDYYIGSVIINGDGELFINGNEYQSGSELDVPGYYQLTVIGSGGYVEQITFTLIPTITYSDGQVSEDLLEGSEFHKPISIYSNGISMTLDNGAYDSDVISSTGEHSLTVFGINEMVFDIAFWVCPAVSGVVDGGTYSEAEIEIFGTVYLDGEVVLDRQIITETGPHRLELLLDGVVYQSIDFTIVSSETVADENLWWEDKIKYIFFVFIALGAFLILRKK